MKKTIQTIVLAALCLNFPASAQQKNPPPSSKQGQVKGKVISLKTREQLEGAAIQNINTALTLFTDKQGEFPLDLPAGRYRLAVFLENYQTEYLEIRMPLKEPLVIELEPKDNNLNEVQIIGYGETTKRLNTGSASTITAKQIENQPVTNVLSALSGQMPGVYVQTTNGLPGGNINIQIRGKGSIAAGTNPLYIIDGVPFESSLVNNGDPITIGNITGAISPLNSLNPEDIETISVLKDADATAIYGSRGANGVVLITTKKGTSGQSKAEFNVSSGVSKVSNLPGLLNLEDYLQIRKQAYANSHIVPTETTAPDLLGWGNSKTIDWPDYLFGKTAHVSTASGSISGGDVNTSFNIGGHYRKESSILPGKNLYQRGGTQLSLNHYSAGRKFNINLSTSIVKDQNQSSNPQYASSGILLPPNFPLLKEDGQYFWRSSNPLAEINATSRANTDNLLTNISIGYTFSNDLKFKLAAGYNRITIKQIQLFPLSSLPPGSDNYSQFGDNSNQSFIVEPQLNYLKVFANSTLSLLAGATYQNRTTESQFILGRNFSSEGLMENLGSAGTLDGRESSSIQYKYLSVFGRANYILDGRYILNATIRRDGSSRFGPGNHYGNFGALGAAWIIGEEIWFKKMFPFISYGKLRGSYGWVGNDQIADYQYLSTYSSAYTIYQGIAALNPSRISNSNFHWETTYKLDYAIELGFWDNKILLNVNRYRNRTKDQLVQYSVPKITGFSSYQANLPAVVENSGWEFELNTKNISRTNWNWTSTFNLTAPKNKLISFEDFQNSSYAQTLQIGYDITRIYGYQFLGVNPNTGLAAYAGDHNDPYFYHTIGKQTPDFYGGLGNTITYGNWSAGVFIQFAKQMGMGGLRGPGAPVNAYQIILNRWQKAGDITNIPKPMIAIDPYYANSTANYFDTSYIRVKNISFSYTVPKKWANKIHLNRLRMYAEGQNLWTFWNRDAAVMDPESGAFTGDQGNIPPLKTFILGLQLTL